MAQFFDIPEDNFFLYVKDYWKEEQSRKMKSTFMPINSSGYDSDHSDDSSSTISTSSSKEE